MCSIARLLALAILLGAPLASAHDTIVAASGDGGGNGIEVGVSSPTSNDQQVTRFNGNGFRTVGKPGNIDDLAKLLPAVQQAAGDTVPQVAVGSTVTSNADGAGPITCQASTDGTQCIDTMQVTTSVPGNNGRSSVADTNFLLVAQIPAGVTCTGTIGNATNACVVQCMNPIGPFGSNVIVQTAAT